MALEESDIFLSVATLGEIRQGIERIRRRDKRSARRLETWLDEVTTNYAAQILPIDTALADQWGRLGVPDPMPVVDALIAATALVHDLVVATRNAKDIARAGAETFNPFDPKSPLQ